MAIATVTCTCRQCGKEFIHSRHQRNRAAADNYESWAAANIDLCPECFKAAHHEQRAAENAETCAAIQLPELTGTPKQIAWANDLRLRFCAAAVKYCNGDELMIRSIQIIIDTKCSARFWIDNRIDVDFAPTLLNRLMTSTDPEDVAMVQKIQTLIDDANSAQTEEAQDTEAADSVATTSETASATPDHEENGNTIKEDENMEEIIAHCHGNDIFRVATDLGVDYTAIIRTWEDKIGSLDPLDAALGLAPLERREAADCAYWEIVKACRSAYFSPMTRADALAIANALISNGCLHLADDLQYNSLGFVYAWNTAHPDEEPIRRTPSFTN